MITTRRAGAVLAACLTALVACGDDGGPGTTTDPCNDNCLTEFGELCNEATGQCYFPTPDSGADADVGRDVPADPDMAEADLRVTCLASGDCAPDEYCEQGDCVSGCRLAPDNCDDCEAFPDTCNLEFSCSPADRVCVSGCVRDRDCDDLQFCNVSSGQCQRGCRDNPDNCDDITGNDDFLCFAFNRQCTDGPCDGDADCIPGAYCDGADRCVWGCRIGQNDCGTGQICDPDLRSCITLTCNCAGIDNTAECDALCDDEGGFSPFYCNRFTNRCEQGCRFFPDGSDNCSGATICEEGSRMCVDGCNVIDGVDSCPFGLYCEEGLCENGCKLGECLEPGTVCDLDAHQCVNVSCGVDTDCPTGSYCDVDTCANGCRFDDPLTPEVDEHTCATGGVCSADHVCEFGCESDDDCELKFICDDTSGLCVFGCGGDDDRCPPGQPCAMDQLFCGCESDGNCDEGEHCNFPTCESDCVPDDPRTNGIDEDNCAGNLFCNTDTGWCQGNCFDPNESSGRNDVPELADCMLFNPADVLDPNTFTLCRGGLPDPEDTYCDGTVNTFCLNGNSACPGGDNDWFSMYLYEGDRVSFSAAFANPATTNFVLYLAFESNPNQPIRAAAETVNGAAATDVLIPVTLDGRNEGVYFLRAFAVSDTPVPYDLRVEFEGVFMCIDDAHEAGGGNDLASDGVPLPNSELLLEESNLSICEGDRDFFRIPLFGGNDFTGAVRPDLLRPPLELTLGLPNESGTDIVPIAFGTFDLDTEAENDRIMQVDVPDFGMYGLRVLSPSFDEAFYDLEYQTLQGAAECPEDDYEPNDTTDNIPGDATFLINAGNQPPVGQLFQAANLCPGELDLYQVSIDSGFEGSFLEAALLQPDDDLELEILDDALMDTITTTPSEPTTGSMVTLDPLPVGNTYVAVRARDGAVLPWQGIEYTLDVAYVLEPCLDDTREPNNDSANATSLVAGVLTAESPCGGLAFSDTCTGPSPPLCSCEVVENLVSCPLDEDWYRVRMIVGDTFNVRVVPLDGAVPEDLLVRIVPPSCDPIAAACEDVRILAWGVDDIVTATDIQVAPVDGNPAILLDYYILVESLEGGQAIEYELQIEVQGENSRDCSPDPWDALVEDYPNDNDVWEDTATPGCVADECLLTLPSASEPVSLGGQLCYWDQQDFFRFTIDEADDRMLLVEFIETEGRMLGTLHRVVGGNLVLQGDLEERPSESGEGVDYAFVNLPVGEYQLEVLMPNRGTPGLLAGTSPNDYTVTLEPVACGDETWSNNEACDGSAVIDPVAMCGAGATGCTDCTCEF